MFQPGKAERVLAADHGGRQRPLRPWGSPHPAGSATRGTSSDGLTATAGRWPSLGSPDIPNPLTMPNTAGITISVSSVEEIMPPIIGTAMRCILRAGAGAPHDRQQPGHDTQVAGIAHVY